MASKVLILGGAGFLGAHLVRRCLAEPGVEVTVLDSLDPRFMSSMQSLEEVSDAIRFVRGDIRDEKLLAEMVPGHDVIFNLAAQSSHTLSIQDPLHCAEINVLGSLKLLEAVRLFNPRASVVYASTTTAAGKVFGEADEEHPEKPAGIYSANKGAAEKYYRIYSSLYGLDTVTLRFANLYGPYGKTSPDFGFINYFIGLAVQDQPLKIFGTGNQLRNVLYAEDAAEILLRSAGHEALRGGVFLATGPWHFSVREIAQTVVRVIGKGRVEFTQWPDQRRKIEVEDAVFTSEKLRGLTGWKPEYDLESGLRKTLYVMDLPVSGAGAKK